MSFLHAERVVARYGPATILHGVDLVVERGTLVALLGASGSGKTTLLRAIAGFNPLASGRIVLDGRDITRQPPERRRMAMVFQSYALWPHMTVAQNLGYGLRLRRVPRAAIAARVESLLATLQLDGLGGRRVTALSGGQRQRVALGRALAVDPDVLLLDEPLSNLDARIRIELRQEIRALQRRLGVTAVHVTHDREEAMVMADRIVVLRDGRIAQEGTPEAVYHRPESAFVAAFMGADNVVPVMARRHADGVLAEAAGVASHLPSATRLAGEGPCAAHFRPVAARLLPRDAPAPGHLALPGRVLAASYPGDIWRYVVESSGRQLVIDSPHGAGGGFAPGEAVTVAVPAESLHLFPT